MRNVWGYTDKLEVLIWQRTQVFLFSSLFGLKKINLGVESNSFDIYVI